ncbi:MAG: hypothetical protein ACJAR9_000226, partial [Celeribacter sp.]
GQGPLGVQHLKSTALARACAKVITGLIHTSVLDDRADPFFDKGLAFQSV